MPPAPPDRPNTDLYRFHTYRYPGDAANGPFQPSNAIASANNRRFYSLVEDLNGLLAIGNASNVPNLALTRMSTVPGGTQTARGREVYMISFGPGPGHANAPAVVITGGVHSREWIAIEFVYLLAEYLILNYTNAPQNRYQRTIRRLINSRRILIVPMLNPDGNRQTVFGIGPVTRLWRKNRRTMPTTPVGWVNRITGGAGPNVPPFLNVHVPAVPANAPAEYTVQDYNPGAGIPPAPAPLAGRMVRSLPNNAVGVDVNRNYTTLAWGYDSPGPNGVTSCWDPADDSFFGPRAGAQAETANAQLIMTNAHPGIATAIDYHSYAMKILYPSETFNNHAIGPDYKTLGKTLRQLIHSQGVHDYQLGSANARIGYDAVGTMPDRAAQAHQARAFTIELDPARGTVNGFQISANDIQDVFEKNIRGALAAIAAPAQPANIHAARVQRLPILATMLDLMTWNVFNRGNQLPL
jgi:Zinc carboxypeptidase